MWSDIKPDGRDWFALTMNGLAINDKDIEEGRKVIAEKSNCIVRLSVNENDTGFNTFVASAPLSVPKLLSSWEQQGTSDAKKKVKIVRPSVGEKEGTKFRGGVMSETKTILLSKGMHAADYGTLVHEVMRGKSPSQLLRSYRLDINEDDERKVVQGLEGMYRRFMTTDPMLNKAEAGKDLKELPFELREGDVVYIGVIDRLVQLKDGGWALIDYKSIDPLEPHVAEQVSAFREQMGIYAKSVGKMVEGKIGQYIYLTETGDMVPL